MLTGPLLPRVYTIATRNGERCVSGFTVPGVPWFAVRRIPESRHWQIDHLPSGRFVPLRFKTRSAALDAVEILAQRGKRWRFTDPKRAVRIAGRPIYRRAAALAIGKLDRSPAE